MNTIKMLERQHISMRIYESYTMEVMAGTMHGEMAQECLERDAFNHQAMPVWDRWPVYVDLRTEARRRGLWPGIVSTLDASAAGHGE